MMNEEPCGPVVSVNRFSEVDEMLAECNRLPFGLAAYAFTSRSGIIDRLGEYVDTGVLGGNTVVVTPPEAPFGGVPDSGYGREGGTEGLEALLQPKMVAVDTTL